MRHHSLIAVAQNPTDEIYIHSHIFSFVAHRNKDASQGNITFNSPYNHFVAQHSAREKQNTRMHGAYLQRLSSPERLAGAFQLWLFYKAATAYSTFYNHEYIDILMHEVVSISSQDYRGPTLKRTVCGSILFIISR